MSCEHTDNFQPTKLPLKHECDQCVITGDRWVHLRTCQICGATLCCDSSPNTHMTKHYHETGHSLVISAEPNERWVWCYEHEQLGKY